MSQFGGTKNPPWARPQAVTDFTSVTAPSNMNSLPQSQVATPLMQQQQVQPMYGMPNAGQNVVNQQQYTAQQLLGLQAQQQAAAALQQQAQVIPQPGIAIPTTLATTQVATVSYPAPRAAAVQTNQPKQRVFTGTITKLHDNFGFVDEDVFFQTSCVKGSAPKVNDRVLVEASFNANMPFKWNATRIQVLPNQVGPQNNHQGLNKPVFGVQQGNQMGGFPGQPAPQPLMQQGFNEVLMPRNPGNAKRNDRFERDRDRKRDRDRRERNERPAAPRKRSRSKSPSKRLDSNSHQRSPARRRPRIVPRYVVQVPKLSFDMKEANVVSLKSRYTNLYIPSDFFNASFEWTEAFPCYRPFQMGNHCGFHVMHKDVEPLTANDSVLDPPDADHLFSAKVMLMSCPNIEDLYHKSCALAEDPPEVQEGFVHPTRLIHFLVGLKGKNETMAIGGPWSPSLDGANPGDDPQVLIRTAIRTTKALTGIDLTRCTQWYQFAEVRYLRQEEMHKGKLVPARVETTVIFLPDVWSCNPTRLEWATLQAAYKKQLQKKVAAVSKDGGKEANSQEEEEAEGEVAEENKEPTHHSELDPKTMKIVDLRRELECRSVSSKGLKSQLIARLTKALKTEQEKEEEQEATETQQGSEVSEEVKKNLEAAEEKSDEKKKEQEEEKKKKEEREKASLERKYALPDNPVIIVHPNSVAKAGKFDCSLMSLSVLLDYRPEDNKEHSFEVSLFAELFNEMLMRDYGFEIYKALMKAPEKKEEEKKDKRSADDKSSKDASSAKKKKTEDKEKSESSKKDSKESKDKDKKKDEDKSSKDQEKKDDEEEEEEEGKKDKDKEKKREKKKYQTREPALLLAFTYFDQNHTGYLLDKDVEEIIHTIGLQLSRAQVKKLVQKVVTRDALNYRKMTDKTVGTPGEKEEAAPDEKELKVADIVKLSKGNSEYLHGRLSVKSDSMDEKPEKKSPVAKDTEEAESHMITYKGAMIDLESLMAQLERSEKTRAEMEKQMIEVNNEKDQMKKSIDAKDEKSEKLSAELKNLKQKLSVQEKITTTSESTNKRYLEALMESRDHLNAMLSTVTNAIGEKESAATEAKKEPESNGNS